MYEKCESAWLTWIEINDKGVNVMSIRYILYNMSIFAYFVQAWGWYVYHVTLGIFKPISSTIVHVYALIQ
jgi:hypothetical protein